MRARKSTNRESAIKENVCQLIIRNRGIKRFDRKKL
jgi:hypothetical protein